ncbi:AsmA family protein [Noviherbaspirillum sp.]|uniref:AsmA family protein n=1 Tax=Noviherbaspirillum sp. TaxID=1926288 RepID=UPI002FDF1694
MRTIARWAGIALLAFFLLLTAAVTLFAEPMIEFVASKALGREVRIAGDVGLSVSPLPAITVSHVSVANPEWSNRQYRFKADLVSVSMRPLTVFEDRMSLGKVRLVAPILYLEKSLQGAVSWGTHSSKVNGTTSAKSALPDNRKMPFIEHIMIADGRFVYENDTEDTRVTATVDFLEGFAASGNPVRLAARGEFEGQPYQLDVKAGSLAGLNSASPYPVEVSVQAAALQAHADGSIASPMALDGVNMQLLLEGGDLASVLPMGQGAIAPLPFKLRGRLEIRGDAISLPDFNGHVGKSSFRGGILVDTSARKPLIDANMEFSKLDIEPLLHSVRAFDIRSSDARAQEPGWFQWSTLKTFDARVRFHGKKIGGDSVPLDDLALDLSLSNGVLVVDPFRLDIADGHAQARLRLDVSGPHPHGNIAMDLDDVAVSPLLEMINGRAQISGIVDGRFEVNFSSDGVGMADGRLDYRAPANNTALTLELARIRDSQQWLLRMQGGGTFRGASTTFSFTGQPFQLLTTPDAMSAVALEMSLADTDMTLAGTVAEFGNRFDLDVSLSGPGTERLSKIINMDIPRFPNYAISGHVMKQKKVMQIDGLQARIGKSSFAGSALVRNVDALQRVLGGRGDTGSSKLIQEPFIQIGIVAKTLAYADFDQLLDAEGDSLGWHQKLRSIDADISLAIDRFFAPQQVLLRNVRLECLLKDGLLTIAPLRFQAGGGKATFNAALRVSERENVFGSISARVEDVHLEKALKPLDLGERFPGWLNADIDLELDAKSGKPMSSGIVRYNDKTGTNLRMSVTSTESGLKLKGSGRFDNEPFSLTGTAGPIAQVMRNRSYPFNIDVTMLETNGKIRGSLRKPLRLAGLKSTLEISGPNPRKVESLVGFRLPELPPYRLRGDLSRRKGVWRFTDFKGTVGDSDLSGRLTIDNTGSKPYVNADIHSDLLDLDDLAGIIGASPGTGPDESATPAQRKKALERRRLDTVLPDEDFEFDMLSQFNANVHYDAKRIDLDALPLDNLALNFSLKEGRLLLTPITLGIAGGTVKADIRLVERPGERPVRGKVALELNNIKLAEIVRNYDIADNSTGRISGRANFRTQGESVAKMLGSINGQASILMAGGTLDALLVELAGLDGGEALLLWLGQEQTVKVRCAYVSATARNGVLSMDKAVVDTTDTRFTMDGNVHFGNEALDLVISAHPKDFSIFAVRAPFVVEGRLKNPEFHPSWDSLLVRGAAALSLAAIAPPAALLALIEPGTGKNSPCSAMAG